MRWTIGNEELLLALYFEVKTRYEKKMKKDVKRCKWIAGKLRDEAKLDYSTTLVAKLNIMKMAEISLALGSRVSSIQPKPFWMRIWMRNPSPRYYVKASCDLRQEEQVGIIQNVLTAPKHLHYFSSELHTGTSNYFHSMLFLLLFIYPRHHVAVQKLEKEQ